MKQMLLVQNDLGQALSLRDAFTEAGYAVCCATSIREAMQLILTHPFALMLLDGTMEDTPRVRMDDLISVASDDTPVLMLGADEQATDIFNARHNLHVIERDQTLRDVKALANKLTRNAFEMRDTGAASYVCKEAA
ncbi:hypothetical protein [Actibacterium sp. 188UL27-1]|uniref:hypothetical protein n=1 Tax=Actibacterium sp. 188UL27-1 TaxID=2786961 RepID=UPI00195DFEF9|nr:hypothetical protein [Actibacterium sp. 188UL27-1]MBM7065981.1 hypothetical protein [Actibacterium sp. 188UL27-1]